MNPKRRLSFVQGYLELGMLKEAAAEFGRVPAPENASSEAVALWMAILQEKKDWKSLRDTAADFVKRTPEEAGAWITWAYATRRADSLIVAENILLEAEVLHPIEPTIQFNLGCYACQRGDLVLAKERVERAIQIDADYRRNAREDPDLAPLRAAEPSWPAEG